MANNRIFMRCRGCGECLYLGGTYFGGYYMDKTSVPLEDRLNAFYEKHNYCDLPKVKITAYDELAFPLPDDASGCDGAFDIVYESTWGTEFDCEGKIMSENIIKCDGYMAFRGRMRIALSGEDAGSYEKAGDWLYKPDTGCWYCGGRSYPDVICTIVKVQ